MAPWFTATAPSTRWVLIYSIFLFWFCSYCNAWGILTCLQSCRKSKEHVILWHRDFRIRQRAWRSARSYRSKNVAKQLQLIWTTIRSTSWKGMIKNKQLGVLSSGVIFLDVIAVKTKTKIKIFVGHCLTTHRTFRTYT